MKKKLKRFSNKPNNKIKHKIIRKIARVPKTAIKEEEKLN
jgi:hypothetical protein